MQLIVYRGFNSLGNLHSIFVLRFWCQNHFWLCQARNQLALCFAQIFNSLVPSLNSIYHYLLRNLVGSTLNHAHAICRAANHHIQLANVKLRKGWVYNGLAINNGNPNSGNLLLKRQFRKPNGNARRANSKNICVKIFVRAHYLNYNLHLAAKAFWEHRANRAVYNPRFEGLVIARRSLSFLITARQTPCGISLFPELNG